MGEHLFGASNRQIAHWHGYATAAVAASTISRIKAKIRNAFPDLALDLEPQRIY